MRIVNFYFYLFMHAACFFRTRGEFSTIFASYLIAKILCGHKGTMKYSDLFPHFAYVFWFSRVVSYTEGNMFLYIFLCYILFLVLACSKCKFFWLWNAPLVGNCSRIVLNLQFKVLHKKAGRQWRKGGDWKKVLLSWPKLQVQREFCLLLSAYSGQLRVCCSCLPASHRHPPSTMAISKSAFLKALANCPKSVKSFCMLAYSLSCK